MASKQEKVSEWMTLAKAYDKAEKEMGVIPYVIVSLRNRRTDKELFQYILPRDVFWRRPWVIEWRTARLLCQYPRDGINRIMSFYDKKTGIEYGFGSLLGKLSSAKAKVTMTTNALGDYINSRRGDMFFDEYEDEVVIRMRRKIKLYLAKIVEIENEIKSRIQEINSM